MAEMAKPSAKFEFGNDSVVHDDGNYSGNSEASASSSLFTIPKIMPSPPSSSISSHHQHLHRHNNSSNNNDELLRLDGTNSSSSSSSNRRGKVSVDEKENRHANANNNNSSSSTAYSNSNDSNSRAKGLATTSSTARMNPNDNDDDDDEVAAFEEEDDNDAVMEGIRLQYIDNHHLGENDDGSNNHLCSNNKQPHNAHSTATPTTNNYEKDDPVDDDDEEERDCHALYHDDDDDLDDDDDNDDDDDDCSEASGDTVVHNDCPQPPPNATQDEITRFYWEWCYGPIIDANGKDNDGMLMGGGSGGGIRSAMRSAPAKSCLSTKKKKVNDINQPTTLADSMTPRRLLHHTSPSYSNPENHHVGDGNHASSSSSAIPNQPQHSTPTMGEYNLSTPTDENDAMDSSGKLQRSIHAMATNSKPKSCTATTRHPFPHPPHHTSAVKFGNNTAAEFFASQPITEMTPIPPETVQKIFPSNKKEDNAAEEEEHGHSRETARNVAMLAEWDDDFDSIVEDSVDYDDDDDDVMVGGSSSSSSSRGGTAPYQNRASDLPGGRTMKRGRKRTPYKNKNHHGSNKSHHRESGSRRRQSSLFSRDRRSLIDLDDSMEIMEEENGRRNTNDGGLPYSVFIDPNEYTSPSSTSISDSVSTLGTPGIVSTTNNAALGISSTNTGSGDILKPVDDNNKGITTTTTREESQRNSLDSACVSPSSLKSSLTGGSSISTSSAPHRMNNNGRGNGKDSISSSCIHGRESSDSNRTSITGKETPNSARTSSSTILRAVHASGALLPGISPRGVSGPGARGDDSSFSMEEVKNAGDGGGRLRPNQLKYSPSSSSSCSSGGGSSCRAGRMFTSPSDSEILNSDIMNLFTQYNLGGTFDDNRSKDLFFLLGKQLSILSEHPTHPFHTSISDLMQWSRSSTHHDKELLEFMHGVLLRGLTPSTSLALIVDDLASSNENSNNNSESKKLLDGMSSLLPSTFFIDQQKYTRASSIVQRSYESMLLDEIKNVSSSNSSSPHLHSHQDWECADSYTVSTCIRHLYQLSCMDWTKLEVDVAERTLVRLQEWAESMERNNWISTTCREKLRRISPMTMSKSSSNATLMLHQHRLQTQINDEISQIALIEEKLALEASRLEETKCIKRYLDAQLSIERCSPISSLAEEIRALILPSPIMASNGTDFSFSLLDGAAEIVLKLAVDNEDDCIEDDTLTTTGGNGGGTSPGIELGCFIKDSDDESIKLLQAILLGEIMDRRIINDTHHGPYMLRENLSSFILESQKSRVEMLHHLSHTISRIDSLVRSVRDLETEEDCVCHVVIPSDNAKDVSLSVTMPTEGGSNRCADGEGWEIQLHFSFIDFPDENLSTPLFYVPKNVTIAIRFNNNDDNNTRTTLLQQEMQKSAQSMLVGSRSADPILLKRICNEMKRVFYQ